MIIVVRRNALPFNAPQCYRSYMRLGKRFVTSETKSSFIALCHNRCCALSKSGKVCEAQAYMKKSYCHDGLLAGICINASLSLDWTCGLHKT